MRVTNSMLTSEAIKNINMNYAKIAKLHNQIATGKKIQRPSESPMIANESAILKSDAERLTQFAHNIDVAKNMAADTENALMNINESVQNIKELAVQASNGTLSLTERESILAEVSQYSDQIISLLNTSSSDKYIFGGYNTELEPIANSADTLTYNGIVLSTMTDGQADILKSELVPIQISKGTDISVSITTLDIIGYGDSNLLSTIDSIIGKLGNAMFVAGDIDTELEQIDSRFSNILNQLSQIGGKEKRLDMIGSQVSNSIFGVESLLSKVEDVDIEETIIKYKMAEQAYNATLAVSADIVKMTLMDYLR